jgi:hypothetical protein
LGFAAVPPLPIGNPGDRPTRHVLGRSEGRSAALRARIVFEAGRDYWMNGVVLATAARMVSAGKGVQAGVRFLSDAVDPMALMGELRKAGVQQTETFELCA